MSDIKSLSIVAIVFGTAMIGFYFVKPLKKDREIPINIKYSNAMVPYTGAVVIIMGAIGLLGYG